MKPFIRSICSFSLFALSFYICAVSLWSYIIPFNFLKKNTQYPLGEKGFTFTRFAELDTTKNVDILFLGSSHAFRGFDNRHFEKAHLKSFNLGTPSQTPLQTKSLLKQYLEQLDPRLIIYEVYPATFDNDGVESSLDIIANSEFNVETVKMACQVNHIKTYNSLIYDSFSEILGLNDDFKEPKAKAKDQYIRGGFVQTAIRKNESPITESIKQNWKDRWSLKEAQKEAFLGIIKMIEERKIPFLLVQMPVTREAYHLYKNNDEVDLFFAENGDYINLNKRIVLDDQLDFMDYHHLNQRGVDKTNHLIIEELSRLYPNIFKEKHDE